VPRKDWQNNLAAYFFDQSVIAVGRLNIEADQRGIRQEVGKLSWFGRCSGNHHLGVGPAQKVNVLKSVKMAVRGSLLREIGFDTRLRGKGNVSHWELALCGKLRKRGILIYDPAIIVDHNVAPRIDGDVNARGGFERESYIDGVHNEVLSITEALSPIGRLVYKPWLFFVGTIGTPGLLQVLRRKFKLGNSLTQSWERSSAAREGIHLARETLQQSKSIPSTTTGCR